MQAVRLFNSIPGIKKQFQHIFRCLFEFSQENVHALYFLEIDKTSHYLTEKSREVLNELLDFVYLFFEKGKAAGVIRPLRPVGSSISPALTNF